MNKRYKHINTELATVLAAACISNQDQHLALWNNGKAQNWNYFELKLRGKCIRGAARVCSTCGCGVFPFRRVHITYQSYLAHKCYSYCLLKGATLIHFNFKVFLCVALMQHICRKFSLFNEIQQAASIRSTEGWPKQKALLVLLVAF